MDACDVTNNGRNLGFYQELEIRLKPREIHVVVFVLYMKNNTQISTLHDFSLNIYFYCWKKLKKTCIFTQPRPQSAFPKAREKSHENEVVFYPKMAWPPATYDFKSRNHSNWPSLNLSQNVRERWTNSYWKRQVVMVMFYPVRKTQKKKKLTGRGGGVHPLSLYVRGLKW